MGVKPIPDLGFECRCRNAAAINLLLTRPIAILPVQAGEQIKPFAIGLFEDIRMLLRRDATVTQLRRKIAAYLHTRRYYFASAQPDAMRHDIEGNPVAPISDADRMTAQMRFLALKHKGARPRDLSTDPLANTTSPGLAS